MLSALTKGRKSTLVLSKSVSVSEAPLEVSSCRQIGGTAAYGADPAPPQILDNLSNFLTMSASQHLLLEKGVQEYTFEFYSCQSWVHTPWPLRAGRASVQRQQQVFSYCHCHSEHLSHRKSHFLQGNETVLILLHTQSPFLYLYLHHIKL